MTGNSRQQRIIPCPICEGSGEVSQFKGASRFFLSSDPCPHCLGLGRINEEAQDRDTATDPQTARPDKTTP